MTEIIINNIQKNYKDKKVLKHISTKFEPGKIYGLLGRNGAGKSTLMNLISNREFPTSGDMTINGETVTENEKSQAHIYLSSEKNYFSKDFKVKKIFKSAESFYGEFDWELATKMVERFGLDINSKIGGLSTGYNSITKLIIALCLPVDFIFLDEPILGLDANHRDLFYEFLMETYADRPRTFVIATHIIEEMEKIFEHIILIKNGEIVDDGDVEDLLNSSVMLEGDSEKIAAIEDNFNVFYKHSFTGISKLYVKNNVDEAELPEGISVNKLNLQEYFVGRTN